MARRTRRRSSGRGRPNRGASQAIKQNVRQSIVSHPSAPRTARSSSASDKRLGGGG